MNTLFTVEFWFGRLGPGALVGVVVGVVVVAFCVLYTFDGLIESAIARRQDARATNRVHSELAPDGTKRPTSKYPSTGGNVDRWV